MGMNEKEYSREEEGKTGTRTANNYVMSSFNLSLRFLLQRSLLIFLSLIPLSTHYTLPAVNHTYLDDLFYFWDR